MICKKSKSDSETPMRITEVSEGKFNSTIAVIMSFDIDEAGAVPRAAG
jgi:hypothetical protein